MDLKKFYYIQGVFYTLIGFLLLINLKSSILGAVIGISALTALADYTTSIGLFFGVFFLMGGIALIVITRR